MSGIWTSWINQIDRTQDLDTIVYLGAGYGRDLPDLLGTRARRIVLVEPNPLLRSALEAVAAKENRVTVLPVAIAAQAGNASFNIFNAASYGSLRAPGGLLDVLPGLKVEEMITVKSITPQELFQSLELAPDAVHALILDVPGEDATVVDALAGMDVIPFDHVMMCCTAKPLYEGLPASVDLPHTLDARHYKVVDQYLDDPVLLKFWLRHDDTQQALAHVQQSSAAQVEGLQAEIATLTQQLDAAQENVGQRIKSLEQERGGLQAEIAALTGQLNAAHENAGQRIENLEQERGSLQAEIATLTQQLGAAQETAAQRIENLEQERGSLQAEIATLTQQLGAAKEAAGQHAQERDQTRNEMQAEITRLTQQLGAAQETAAQRIENLEQERGSLQAEIATLTQQLGAAKEAAGQHAQERDQTRNEMQAEITRLTQQLGAAQETAAQRIEHLEQERSRQQTELATLTQQLGAAHEKAAQRSDALEHERSKLHHELATLTRQMRDLRDADMDDLRRRYAVLSEQKNALEALLQDVTAGLIATCEPLEGTPQL
ncbi:hypothetical protein [Sulfitobacter sp.]|uniref:hypothetical protein n=1 Tax=Sulfitobacter sp. TaxID=1903071 RepID=UPI0030029DF9